MGHSSLKWAGGAAAPSDQGSNQILPLGQQSSLSSRRSQAYPPHTHTQYTP
uniref:Uncharacterized protein n=1 Tax=Anguilla anguilla TaxID=7936 RepID=A0A0E9VHX2_ANGAN